MHSIPRNPQHTRLIDALGADDSSTRLQAAMAAGSHPDPELVEVLVERCAIEPDFFVRDMLTWALTRLPTEVTMPALLAQLPADRAQARSQALHTLSKIGDSGAWPAITPALLHDAEPEVARSAWRAAVVLVPEGERAALAADLVTQLGRGDREMQRSLSRALVALGAAIEPALQHGLTSNDPVIRAHARATEQLLADPEAGFELDTDAARRVVALGPDRAAEPTC